MSLDNNKSSQKVLDSDGLKYLLRKMKNTHMSKLATDSELGHVKIGPTNTPSAVNGEGVVAPSYHTHPAQTEITGNAGTASKLKNAVNIALDGAVTGNADFDGSKNITINTNINKNSQAITGKTSLSDLEPGDYIESNGNKYTDSPNGSNSTNDFVISVIGSGNDKNQIFTDLVTGKVYIRVIEDGAASEWKEVLTVSDGTIDINATSADKFKTARNISISGDADGSALFDGSKDVDIDIALSDTGVDADTYGSNSQSNFNATREITIPSYTVDSDGRITASSDQTIKIPESSGGGTGGGISPVNITLAGDVTGSKIFDGTTDVSIDTTLKNSGVTAGTYGQTDNITVENGTNIKIPKITVDAKGRVTSATDTTTTIPTDAFDKVKTTTATSGNIYLSGKSTSNDDTGSELISPNLYYDVTNNTFHAGKIAATIEGVSDTANKLAVARNISLDGDVTGSTSFDGSKDVSISATLKNSGVTADTYGNASNITLGVNTSVIIPKITINAKGIVTSATTTTATISADSLNKVKSSPITTGKIYLSGKSDSTESTSTDVHNSGLYYDTETKTLVAPNISGKASNASSADKLSSAVNITLNGDASGSTSFDGSKSVNITTALANSGVTAGTYGSNTQDNTNTTRQISIPKFVVDAKGRITSTSNQSITLPNTAETASKLASAMKLTATGDATGSVSFDGSENVDLSLSLSNSGVTAGKYGPVLSTTLGTDNTINIPYITVDAKGRIIAAKNSPLTIPDNAFNTVKTDIADSGYIFISGKSELVSGNGTEVINSDLYYDVTNKILHAGKIAGTIEGVSDSANRLAKAVNINLVGAVTGSQAFDGSTSINITTTIETITNEEIDAMMDS